MAQKIDQAIEYLLLRGEGKVFGVTEELEFESADGYLHSLSYITGLLNKYAKVAVVLTIHIPLAGESQPSSCKVVWATNKPATSIVKYRVNGDPDWIEFSDEEELTRYHSILLTGLGIDTLYDIWVRSEIEDTGEYVEAFIWALTPGTALIIPDPNIFILFDDAVVAGDKISASAFYSAEISTDAISDGEGETSSNFILIAATPTPVNTKNADSVYTLSGIATEITDADVTEPE